MFGRDKHTRESVTAVLIDAGADAADAQEIVTTLAQRLSPKDMHRWLADPKKSHPIPDDDPEQRAEWEAKGLILPALNWTAINAIGAGKTTLVIGEAKRFVGR